MVMDQNVAMYGTPQEIASPRPIGPSIGFPLYALKDVHLEIRLLKSGPYVIRENYSHISTHFKLI